MLENPELELRAAFQIALLGMITPEIRAISFEFISSSAQLKFRVHFSKEPHEISRENMSCVLTEIDAGLPFRINDYKEEYIVTPPPEKPNNLSKLVYSRCESPDFLPPA
ncbi:hypothetical protein [Stutzerimonas nitrititolerans]|uniref:hypothetical protein n=1 Tax=Stutzerimonas nitrititolerans TaxID=2482751 RepID=UPI002897D65F|nr:hypothetical protein [Stutzerimonas nitrititolerans]